MREKKQLVSEQRRFIHLHILLSDAAEKAEKAFSWLIFWVFEKTELAFRASSLLSLFSFFVWCNVHHVSLNPKANVIQADVSFIGVWRTVCSLRIQEKHS